MGILAAPGSQNAQRRRITVARPLPPSPKCERGDTAVVPVTWTYGKILLLTSGTPFWRNISRNHMHKMVAKALTPKGSKNTLSA